MKQGNFAQGEHTENNFVKTAEQNGWEVVPATPIENMRHHIDFHIHKEGRSYAVDVKGMKALSRANPVVQDEWFCVEFMAVVYPRSKVASYRPTFDPLKPDFSHGSGRAGWLYGKADLIAFETRRLWVLIEPAEIITECAQIVQFSNIAPSAKEARYRVYSRPERGDLITFIHKTDISSLARGRWRKAD